MSIPLRRVISLALSILIPNYNYCKFVGDAVESAVRQLNRGDEIIVQDGASSDGSDAVLTELAARHPKISYRSMPDSGQSHALNLALARATGEWVGWLNSDEFYLPRCLDMVRETISQVDCDIIYADCITVDEEGGALRLVPSHAFSAPALRNSCFISSCTAFIRREILVEECWDLSYRLLMDWELWLRMAMRGRRFHYLPRSLAAFRIHGAQVTARPRKACTHEFTVLREKYGARASLADRLDGRFRHVALKVQEGAYWRQMRFRREHGRDLRWWS